jgi:hypothetical protein
MPTDQSTKWESCLKIVKADLRIDVSSVRTTSSSGVCRFSSDEPTADERLRLLETSGTLDFWRHPDEDVYSKDDGDPV